MMSHFILQIVYYAYYDSDNYVTTQNYFFLNKQVFFFLSKVLHPSNRGLNNLINDIFKPKLSFVIGYCYNLTQNYNVARSNASGPMRRKESFKNNKQYNVL